jgi:acetyl esterase/lipase
MTRSHILVLPGGGYTHHAAHENEPVVQWLRGIGAEASAFLYPVSTRHPGPLDAIHDEVKRLRASGVDRVGLLGFSAGGHAAGLAALHPGDAGARVDAAILCYPVVSMQLPTDRGWVDELLGPNPSDTLRDETSLERLVTEDAPPFFIWHTAEDAVVPVEHTYLLGRALGAHGVAHSLHVFPKGRHGIGLAKGKGGAEQWTTLCGQWLAELGWLDAR